MIKFYVKIILIIQSIGIEASFSRPVKLGIILPENGPMSSSMCVATALLEREIKKGMNIRYIKCPNGNSTKDTVLAVKLALKKNVDLVIGTRTSQQAIVASRLFDKHNIPFIVPMASNPDITKNKKNVLRILSSSKRYSYLISKAIHKRFNPKKVLVVENKSLAYSQFYANETPENLKKRNKDTDIEGLSVISGQKDFRPLVKKIFSFRPDIIYLPLYTIQTSAIITEVLKSFKGLKAFSHGGIIDGKDYFFLISKKNSKLEIYFNGLIDENAKSPFREEYLSIMKNECSQYKAEPRSAIVYDSVKFTISGLKSEINIKKDLIKNLKKKTFHGVTGLLKYGEDGEPIRGLPLVRIHRGRLEQIDVVY